MNELRLRQNFKVENSALKRVQGNFFLDTPTCLKLGIPQEELNQCNSVYLLRQPKLVDINTKESLRWLNTISDYLDIESLILQHPDCERLLHLWSEANYKHRRYSHWDCSIRKVVLPPSGTADMYIRFLSDEITGDQLHKYLHKDDDLGLSLYYILMWSGSVTTAAPPVGFELKEEKPLKQLKKKGTERGFFRESFGFKR